MRLIDADRIYLDDVDDTWCTDFDDVLAAVEDCLEEQPTERCSEG